LRMGVTPDICVLQNVSFTAAEMQDVAAVVGRDLFTNELRETLGQFEQAKNFGSLIVPKLRDLAEALRVVAARDFAGDLLLRDVQARVVAVLRMAEALSPKYHVVVANPPYAGTSGLNASLQNFAKEMFADSKSDLFATFIERGLNMVPRHGYISMVTMQSWMFLSSYEKLRAKLSENASINAMIHMGNMVMGIAFGTAGTIWKSGGKASDKGAFCFINYEDLDGKAKPTIFPPHNEQNLLVADHGWLYRASAEDFRKIPGCPISYSASENLRSLFKKGLLGDAAFTRLGMATADNNQFLRLWPEVSINKSFQTASSRDDAIQSAARWFPYQKGGDFRKWDGNRDYFVDWEADGRRIQNFKDEKTGKVRSHNYNLDFIFKNGVTWNALTSGKTSARRSESSLFDNAGSSLFTKESFSSDAVMAFINSSLMTKVFPLISPTLNPPYSRKSAVLVAFT